MKQIKEKNFRNEVKHVQCKTNKQPILLWQIPDHVQAFLSLELNLASSKVQVAEHS